MLIKPLAKHTPIWGDNNVACETDKVRPVSVRPVSVRPVSVRPVSVRPVSVRPVSVRPVSVRPVACISAACISAACISAACGLYQCGLYQYGLYQCGLYQYGLYQCLRRTQEWKKKNICSYSICLLCLLLSEMCVMLHSCVARPDSKDWLSVTSVYKEFNPLAYAAGCETV
jgi:hypothetical protein